MSALASMCATNSKLGVRCRAAKARRLGHSLPMAKRVAQITTGAPAASKLEACSVSDSPTSTVPSCTGS